MKEVKFYFYKLEYEFENNLLDFKLESYFKDDFNLKQHLFEIGEHKGFLDKKTNNIYSFQKFKRDFNPTIKDELTGVTREVELKETEYFIEESYLYLDIENNIAIYQKNMTGYSPQMFEKYVLKLLNNKFRNDYFALKPIMSKDGVEKLMNHNIAKHIELKVAAPNIGLLKEFGFSVKDIRDFDLDSLDSIEIKINSKKKTGIFNLSNLANLLNIKDNKDNYEKLKIKASTSYEGTGDLIDLLDEFYVVNEKIKLKDKSRIMDKDDILIKLNTIYNDNINKIKRLIDA